MRFVIVGGMSGVGKVLALKYWKSAVWHILWDNLPDSTLEKIRTVYCGRKLGSIQGGS